jgi:serine/threonine protein kinase
MTWIEGTPLREFADVFPLLTDEQQETSDEALTLRWLNLICQALGVLHRNGLIHGDISPRNLIVSGSDLVLTDYDFVARIGEPLSNGGTLLYCSPSYLEHQPASPSDDIYALAASFFHIVFNKEPFQYGGIQAKERGLNWEGVNRLNFLTVAAFLDKATHKNRELRFSSVAEALVALKPQLPEAHSLNNHPESPAQLHAPLEQTSHPQGVVREERVNWLRDLLQSYPGSRWGNRETRGLDTEFAAETYVRTDLEDILYRDVRERRVSLVVLCGNAGDGKTALLQHLASQLGLGNHPSSKRILEGKMADNLIVRMNLDGSAALGTRSADELLDEFLGPFQQGRPVEDIAHLLAINDGRLLEWIAGCELRNNGNETPLTKELSELLEESDGTQESHIRFINLNHRSLVGGITQDRTDIQTHFLNRLLDQMYGAEHAPEIWTPCQLCSAKDRCEVYRAARIFGPDGLQDLAPSVVRSRARKRLFEGLQAVHLRGETHVTVRELRAAIVYILFGVHFCDDYHGDSAVPIVPFWDRAFSPNSPERQGDVLKELARFDPGLEAHPQIDRYLLSMPTPDSTKTAPHYDRLVLESARRRAFFEWTEDNIQQIAGDTEALGLARGRHLSAFRDLALDRDPEERINLCERLCRGISHLEDLPTQAVDRPGVVPFRITPRTPTETAFWVEKPISAFQINADIPPEVEMDRLHRQVNLIYRYQNGREEPLKLGADLFHLLLELGEGYQLGDVSTDDTFAHLSIFVQRLVREDEHKMFAWNPMQDEAIYEVTARIEHTADGVKQRMLLHSTSDEAVQ